MQASKGLNRETFTLSLNTRKSSHHALFKYGHFEPLFHACFCWAGSSPASEGIIRGLSHSSLKTCKLSFHFFLQILPFLTISVRFVGQDGFQHQQRVNHATYCAALTSSACLSTRPQARAENSSPSSAAVTVLSLFSLDFTDTFMFSVRNWPFAPAQYVTCQV